MYVWGKGEEGVGKLIQLEICHVPICYKYKG